MSDANAYAKGPVSQSSSPLVLRLTMSRHLAIIRVAAVTVVKVEAVKEPVPSQRSTRQMARHCVPQHEWGRRLGDRTFLFVFAYVTKTEV